MELLHVLAYSFIALLSCLYLFLHKRSQYWAERDVLHDAPNLFYGNMREVGRTQCLRDVFYDFYMKYKSQAPFGGFYLSFRRAVVLFDLDLVKQVLIKDFNNFAHRGNYYNERDDPLTAHLFNLDGPKWRKMRQKLTPTFTAGKMKFMFGTVVEVADRFINMLGDLIDEQPAEQGTEIKELLARFTTDVIGSCAFGLECNSLKDPNAKFRLMGKKVFTERRLGRFLFSFVTAFPNLARKLHMKVAPDDVSEFFMGVVRDTVEYRDREQVQRNDFMNLLMELRNANETEGLTLEEIAAQAFVFFLAGFETSSSTMGFVLYELALNQDIQDKARAEVCEMFERHDNKLTYESLGELKYLQQVLYETMRMYSIVTILLRKTINDYPVPNTKHVIEQGTVVIVPVDAIHRDPAIYEQPEVFKPERFAPEELKKRHHMAWLPFGEGQRDCIGARFGKMQAMIGLTMLLKHFRFRPAAKTPTPMEMDKKTFILTPKNSEIYLTIERI